MFSQDNVDDSSSYQFKKTCMLTLYDCGRLCYCPVKSLGQSYFIFRFELLQRKALYKYLLL